MCRHAREQTFGVFIAKPGIRQPFGGTHRPQSELHHQQRMFGRAERA